MRDLSPFNNVVNDSGETIGISDRPMYTTTDFHDHSLDAAKRLKVSNAHDIYTLTGADYFDSVRYLDTSISGSGTLTGDANSKSVKLSTTTASGDKVIAQGRRRIEYNKGNSQEILMTGRFEAGKTNLRQRYGYFCNTHGLFLEVDGTTCYVVRRSSTTGSLVDTRVAQSAWNVDKLDGTGPSGVDIDMATLNKQLVIGMDFLWLGSFHVRFFIAYEEKIIVIHNMKFSGLLDVPYMDSGMAPFRVEIENTGAVASASSMYATCASVKTYGSESHDGRIRVVDTQLTPVSVGTSKQIIAGIRLNSNYINGSAKPLEFDLFPTSGNSYGQYEVVYNPTLTGATWSALPGICDGLTNSPSYTGGSVIGSGYFSTANKNQNAITFGESLRSDVYLGSDISGNADALVLVLEGQANFTILFSGQYVEYV